MIPIKSNLEPIEDSDLDLEGRIRKSDVDSYSNATKEKQAFRIEKESPKEIVFAEKDSAYKGILSKVQSQSAISDDVASDADVAIKKTDSDSQVTHLVELAYQKGVVYAVKVARHIDDNYVIDAFHDQLISDKLHDALVQKGIIDEV